MRLSENSCIRSRWYSFLYIKPYDLEWLGGWGESGLLFLYHWKAEKQQTSGKYTCSQEEKELMTKKSEFQVGYMYVAAQFSSVQSLSRVPLFATPWIAARQASLSITISWSSLRLTPIESVMPSSHLFLCRPLLLLPPIPPSIRVFSNESTLHKVLEFQL